MMGQTVADNGSRSPNQIQYLAGHDDAVVENCLEVDPWKLRPGPSASC